MKHEFQYLSAVPLYRFRHSVEISVQKLDDVVPRPEVRQFCEIAQIADQNCGADRHPAAARGRSGKDLLACMVGREMSSLYPAKNEPDVDEEVVLRVDALSTDYVKDASFEVRRGEILGFSGMIGSGRTELMRIFGYPIAPVVVGLILGPLAEQQLRRALSISQGDVTVLFTSPIAAVLLVIAALALIVPLILRARGRGEMLAQLAASED